MGEKVSTRDKLTVPVGEALGFYAASFSTRLEYDPSQTCWDNARQVHQLINASLATTNVFRSLSAELLAPPLLDALYFRKYGLITIRLAEKLLQQMHWQAISYG